MRTSQRIFKSDIAPLKIQLLREYTSYVQYTYQEDYKQSKMGRVGYREGDQNPMDSLLILTSLFNFSSKSSQ